MRLLLYYLLFIYLFIFYFFLARILIKGGIFPADDNTVTSRYTIPTKAKTTPSFEKYLREDQQAVHEGDVDGRMHDLDGTF